MAFSNITVTESYNFQNMSTPAPVICTCSNDLGSKEELYLRNLLRSKLTIVSRPVEWIDHKKTQIEISPDHKLLYKSKGKQGWDKVVRSAQPLTRGKNILEFRVEHMDRAPLGTVSMVVGVHPTPDCEAGVCEPGFHVSSLGVTFHTVSRPNNDDHDTSWMLNDNIIRLEVDFNADTIQVFCNGVLRMECTNSHKPSTMPNSYFTFMLSTVRMQIRILSSSITI